LLLLLLLLFFLGGGMEGGMEVHDNASNISLRTEIPNRNSVACHGELRLIVMIGGAQLPVWNIYRYWAVFRPSQTAENPEDLNSTNMNGSPLDH
jgi:hypothetical protein